ncbi:recombinant farnesyl diphosphate synthase At 2.6 angstroms resolution [Gloeophyllum trabeum ATCC 11539]|uniref:(2E,6E)-farnesyl diphosphate synthase n=1 Tax=Gloeophyllum trabeum (strain ATCC 11539 / FP-39264 / Madison 617) TaxID=670483 RepID=S7QKR8_GLOTA|nr:recombinant farnesyl diphosphate synthase At 2.6 angstroms resolution [Gloeophyllum trabeum ATCC 11539]EPQ59858.1 recombinant farnesyl diphosphate synthase At 2.6 angstroms resolution [Gloeophyllum trabeum ATCC 11539]
MASSTAVIIARDGLPAAQDKRTERQRFEEVWNVLRDDVLADFRGRGMPQDAVEWYARNIDHNTSGGKRLRGLLVVESVKILRERILSDSEFFQAAILGWCVELLQAWLLVADDVMDHSATRRGKPCWYKMQGVNLIAINDAFMLESAIYFLLKKYFRQESYYVDLLELFQDITYETEMGQLLDLLTATENSDKVDLSKFSFEGYRRIAIYKSAFFTIHLPVALAMAMCRISVTDESLQILRDLSCALGEYGQIQDDFLDYAGDSEHTGKVGTDIINNKCSWCIITALALATPEQRWILKENYGRKDEQRERRVREVFEELRLRERYAAYEDDAYERITRLIEAIPEEAGGVHKPGLKRDIFKVLLEKMYRRTK